jgi:hypothetical protein
LWSPQYIGCCRPKVQVMLSYSRKVSSSQECKRPSSIRISHWSILHLVPTTPPRSLRLKPKAVPLHATKTLGGEEYSSYSFSALDEGEWSASRSGSVLRPGKGPPVPIVQEDGWASEPVWTQRLEEIYFRFCRGSNLYRPVVQPVVRHYTAWATGLKFSQV